MNDWNDFDDYVNNVIMQEELYKDEALEQYLEQLEWDELDFEMSDYIDIE